MNTLLVSRIQSSTISDLAQEIFEPDIVSLKDAEIGHERRGEKVPMEKEKAESLEPLKDLKKEGLVKEL